MSRNILIMAIALLMSCSGGGGGGAAPISGATNDSGSLDEDNTLQVNVTANDTNVAPATANITRAPANGTATINNGVVTYTPSVNFSGSDSLDYNVTSNNNTGSNTATLSLTIRPSNDAPLAIDDSAALEVNGSIDIEVLSNDSDVDDDQQSLVVQIVDAPLLGVILVLANNSVSYAAAPGFTGTETFTYRAIDPAGAASNIATVTITINDPNLTEIAIEDITIPSSAYISETNAGEIIQVSAPIQFQISSDTISFVASLTGPSVVSGNSLFILDTSTPQGVVLNRRESIFCDLGLCTVQVPKATDIQVEAGNWTVRLATRASSIALVNFEDYQLDLARRVGPRPDIDSRMTWQVRPFLTGTLGQQQIDAILAQFRIMAQANDIDLELDQITTITDSAFAEVSSDFRTDTTAALVLMGDPEKINIFFLDGFSDPGGGGLLGISGGLPGALGLPSEYNGVLINGRATFSNNDPDFYHRTTAEFTLHEVSHLLGLFHTTEADAKEHDVILDTPECQLSSDTNHNNQANASECLDGLNPMFWENDLSSEKATLSAGQRSILRSALVSLPPEPD